MTGLLRDVCLYSVTPKKELVQNTPKKGFDKSKPFLRDTEEPVFICFAATLFLLGIRAACDPEVSRTDVLPISRALVPRPEGLIF